MRSPKNPFLPMSAKSKTIIPSAKVIQADLKLIKKSKRKFTAEAPAIAQRKDFFMFLPKSMSETPKTNPAPAKMARLFILPAGVKLLALAKSQGKSESPKTCKNAKNDKSESDKKADKSTKNPSFLDRASWLTSCPNSSVAAKVLNARGNASMR